MTSTSIAIQNHCRRHAGTGGACKRLGVCTGFFTSGGSSFILVLSGVGKKERSVAVKEGVRKLATTCSISHCESADSWPNAEPPETADDFNGKRRCFLWLCQNSSRDGHGKTVLQPVTSFVQSLHRPDHGLSQGANAHLPHPHPHHLTRRRLPLLAGCRRRNDGSGRTARYPAQRWETRQPGSCREGRKAGQESQPESSARKRA
jgi:hypothetical protein